MHAAYFAQFVDKFFFSILSVLLMQINEWNSFKTNCKNIQTLFGKNTILLTYDLHWNNINIIKRNEDGIIQGKNNIRRISFFRFLLEFSLILYYSVYFNWIIVFYRICIRCVCVCCVDFTAAKIDDAQRSCICCCCWCFIFISWSGGCCSFK